MSKAHKGRSGRLPPGPIEKSNPITGGFYLCAYCNTPMDSKLRVEEGYHQKTLHWQRLMCSTCGAIWERESEKGASLKWAAYHVPKTVGSRLRLLMGEE